MVKFLKYILFIFIIQLYSCVPMIHNKSRLTIKKSLRITEIKTDGYYFALDSSQEKDDKFVDARILFEDGYFRDIGRISSKYTSEYFTKRCSVNPTNTYQSSKSNLECMLDNYEYFFKVKTNFLNRNAQIWNWGRFEIIHGEITIQYFYNYLGDYYLVEEKGSIISSNSFRIKSIFDNKTKKLTNVDVTYLFEPYNVKNILTYKPGNMY